MPHLTQLISRFHQARDDVRARTMKSYMKGQFAFLGIYAPHRRRLQQDVVNKKLQEGTIDWEWVDALFRLEEREFQYVAIDYLSHSIDFAPVDTITHLERYITWKPWWDTIDIIAPLIGILIQQYPTLEQKYITHYIEAHTIWLRRISLIYQLRYKENTNTTILTHAITTQFGSNEFFINKAIGWALREYSKYNSTWVQSFLAQYQAYMHSLSIREAQRYMKAKGVL